MMPIQSYAGLLRSLLVYYGHPLRHRRLCRLYSAFISSGDLVFDVGAHVGNHTRAFTSLGARVIAVEPQPLFAAFLRRVSARSPAVQVLEGVLDSAEGQARLHLSRAFPTVSTVNKEWMEQVSYMDSFRNVHWDSALTVPAYTLDALIGQYGLPAFCKLDVEGAELRVLSGLNCPIAVIAYEFLPAFRQIALDCLQRLMELGDYQFNWSMAESARLQPAWVDSGAAESFLRGLPVVGREGNLFARLK